MNSEEALSHIPSDLQQAPWLQQIVGLLQTQSRLIQEQAEQITALKQTVQDLKDEIARLTKTPKRPKFRPGGGDPESRSGNPNGSTGSADKSSVNKLAPKKIRQEIRISAQDVPQGSRFKGYQE